MFYLYSKIREKYSPKEASRYIAQVNYCFKLAERPWHQYRIELSEGLKLALTLLATLSVCVFLLTTLIEGVSNNRNPIETYTLLQQNGKTITSYLYMALATTTIVFLVTVLIKNIKITK